MATRTRIFVLAVVACSYFGGGCDSIEPTNDDFLVVEGFVETGKPLPDITLIRAQSLDASPATIAVQDATLQLTLNDRVIPYLPSTSEPGKYRATTGADNPVPARSRFRIDIEWRNRQISTEDVVPPPIRIDSVRIYPPEKPVVAVLVDTLRLDTPQVGARKGFIYPIDVYVWWTTEFVETNADSLYWIEARLRPQVEFSSKVLDVVLLNEQVLREKKVEKDIMGHRLWKGVYAVPVADSLAPLPDHTVQVQLARGSEAYGLYAASKNAPERREPISNIDGAIGIMAGVSLDFQRFEINGGQPIKIYP